MEVKPQIKLSNNRLQLQFTYPKGKRHCFSIGLEDDRKEDKGKPVQDYHDSLNLRIARGIIATIKKDVQENIFDFSYKKYKFKSFEEPITIEVQEKIKLKDIWDKYSHYQIKTNRWQETTFYHNQKTLRVLDNIPETRNFLESPLNLQYAMLERYSTEYVRRIMQQLNAACNWATLESVKLLDKNPFSTLPKIKQVSNTKGVTNQAFKASEVVEIIQAFENDTYLNLATAKRFNHSFYTDYVRFMFLTGTRPEEACELRLRDIFSEHINISRAYRNDIKQAKRTKNFKLRKFPINKQLQEVIDRKVAKLSYPEEFIFKSITGKRFDYANFPSRTWNKVINGLVDDGKIEQYLPPYNCRHTFISHSLAKGVTAKQLEFWVGTSSDIIMRNYASIVDSIEPPALYTNNLLEVRKEVLSTF